VVLLSVKREKMKNKDDKLLDRERGKISEFVEVEATLLCTKKGCTSSLGGYDEYDVSSKAYESGWRVRGYIVYCPNCVKKYLKKKK
jgi:hypothetical protein